MAAIQNEIVTEAIEYIFWHVWESVTLEEIAGHCHVSVSYLSRIFKEQTGQSVYAFIKRTRIEQSAMKLKMERDRIITEIGEDYGYSASNYSSVFSSYFNQSPSAFRRKALEEQTEQQKIFDEINEKIRIENRPDYLVMYERTIGSYSGMKQAWCDFMERHREDRNENTIFFERTFDDPEITKKNQCVYDICMTTDHPEKFQNVCILTGGKYAVYPFKGYIDEIYGLNQKLVGIWFPFSHHVIDERYSYDRYYCVENDGYMEFEICIPIK